jgi:hypothetical protein
MDALDGNARRVGLGGSSECFAEGEFRIIGQQGFSDLNELGSPDQRFTGPGSNVATECGHLQRRTEGAQFKPHGHRDYHSRQVAGCAFGKLVSENREMQLWSMEDFKC